MIASAPCDVTPICFLPSDVRDLHSGILKDSEISEHHCGVCTVHRTGCNYTY